MEARPPSFQRDKLDWGRPAILNKPGPRSGLITLRASCYASSSAFTDTGEHRPGSEPSRADAVDLRYLSLASGRAGASWRRARAAGAGRRVTGRRTRSVSAAARPRGPDAAAAHPRGASHRPRTGAKPAGSRAATAHSAASRSPTGAGRSAAGGTRPLRKSDRGTAQNKSRDDRGCPKISPHLISPPRA
jgi:hypothetical protein